MTKINQDIDALSQKSSGRVQPLGLQTQASLSPQKVSARSRGSDMNIDELENKENLMESQIADKNIQFTIETILNNVFPETKLKTKKYR